MKKTLTVNLGGTVFHIDEDAYLLLDNYLMNLKQHFHRQQGSEEIVNDMELRISELFQEKKLQGTMVIDISCVEAVIAQLGKPEELNVGEEDATADEQQQEYTQHVVGKKLFRNPEDKLIGGVASGLAAYLGWDVTAVRLALLLLLFLGYGSFFVIYLVLWIVIPEAKSATEKLQMRGQSITIENIGKTVTEGFEKVTHGVHNYVRSGKPRSTIQKVADAFVAVVGFLLKALFILLVIACSPVLLVLALVFVALVLGGIIGLVGGGAALLYLVPAGMEVPILTASSPIMLWTVSVSLIICMALPLALLIYTLLRPVLKWGAVPRWLSWSLFIWWLVCIAVCLLFLPAIGWHLPLILS